MTFPSPIAFQIQKAWFNPDTQKIEVSGIVKEEAKGVERVEFRRNKNEAEYI